MSVGSVLLQLVLQRCFGKALGGSTGPVCLRALEVVTAPPLVGLGVGALRNVKFREKSVLLMQQAPSIPVNSKFSIDEYYDERGDEQRLEPRWA